MATATAMYHSGINPLRKVTRNSTAVHIPKGLSTRRLHKAFLRYHDPANWPVLRDALRRMGRSDLIGNGKRHLIPAFQPRTSAAGAGVEAAGTPARRGARGAAAQSPRFRTQHARAETRDAGGASTPARRPSGSGKRKGR
jgi:hypothetical protein